MVRKVPGLFAGKAAGEMAAALPDPASGVTTAMKL